jgi:hypothetical protein
VCDPGYHSEGLLCIADSDDCIDNDTDGYGLDCAAGGDCDDDDKDNWISCNTCVDGDGDTSFVGCDAYATRQGPDCDDGDNTVYQLLTGYVDADTDGHGTGPPQQVCSGPALPTGFAAQGGDCSDDDSLHWNDCAGTVTCEVLVVGGSLGGVAAAHEAASTGADTCLVARWDWLGGQATSQGVSAFDELFYEFAEPYRDLRRGIREHYEQAYTVHPDAYWDPKGQEPFAFNPGKCTVSALCYEPPVGAAVIEQQILAPLAKPAGQFGLHIWKGYYPTEVFKSGDAVTGVRFVAADGGSELIVNAEQTIDATELGDLLPLANAAYRVGMEAQSETLEPDAELTARPDCVQPITFPFILERRPETENHVILEPPNYDPSLYWVSCRFGEPECCFYQENCLGAFCPTYSFWRYRRSAFAAHLGGLSHDLSMINHWSNDFNRACGPLGCNIIDRSPADMEEILTRAREFTLGYIYYIQTEACWDNNPTRRGHPYLRVRTDLMGTTDGLSMEPYIRESRRMRAETTIVQQDAMSRDQTSSWQIRVTTRAERTYHDSVGIARYNFDRHPCNPVIDVNVSNTAGSGQIPLGALIPETVDGLLAGCKNIGTTSITNGMYRLHPVEWNIGLAAGATAAMAVELDIQPRALRANDQHLRRLQHRIVSGRGGPIYWWSDQMGTTRTDWGANGLSAADNLDPTDSAHVAAQMLGVLGVFNGHDRPQFDPGDSLTRGQAAKVVVRAFDIQPVPITDCRPSFPIDVGCGHPLYGYVQALADRGITSGCAANTYCVSDPLTRAQLAVFMVRAACDPVWDETVCPLDNPAILSYSDISSHPFYRYIETAHANGWLQTEAPGPSFDPEGAITRRAAALWVWEKVRAELAL